MSFFTKISSFFTKEEKSATQLFAEFRAKEKGVENEFDSFVENNIEKFSDAEKELAVKFKAGLVELHSVETHVAQAKTAGIEALKGILPGLLLEGETEAVKLAILLISELSIVKEKVVSAEAKSTETAATNPPAQS